MKTLEELYEYADNNSISLYNRTNYNKKAYAIEESGIRAIVLDKTKIEDGCEEKVVLAEELGHLACDALIFAKDYANPLFANNIRKAEQRALSWSIINLIPYKELKNAIRQHPTLYEVADFFSVPFSFIPKCIEYYRTKGRQI